MGKVTDSILGGTTGRTGRIVIANLFGTEITRMRPTKSKKPNSPKQDIIRERMLQSTAFLSGYKTFASLYYGDRNGMLSRYNLAMANVLRAYHIDYVGMQITRANEEIIFSKGKLPEVALSSLISTTPSSFTVTWEDNSDGTEAMATDQVCILYCEQDTNRTKLVRNVATRADSAVTVSLLRKFVGKTVHVWLCLLSEDGKLVSTSDYAGDVVIS